MSKRNAHAIIRRHMRRAGYSVAQIEHGLAWADAQGFDDTRAGLILTVSRVLYDDDQLDAGAARLAASGPLPH